MDQQQSPEAIIAGYQQLLGAANYRCAMAENAAQQLAGRVNELQAELAKLKEQPTDPPAQSEQPAS